MQKKHRVFSGLLALCIFLRGGTLLFAQEISVGKSCRTKGSWTTEALEFAQEIKDVARQIQLGTPVEEGEEGAAQRLQPHPCRVLAEALRSIPDYQGGSNRDYQRLNIFQEAIHSKANPDTASLHQQATGMLAQSSASAQYPFLGAILDQVYSGALEEEAVKAMGSAGSYSAGVLQSLMAALPSSQACFVNHPQLAQSILSSSVNLFSALTGSYDMLSLGVVDLLSQFSSFWQNQRMAFITRELDKTDFWQNVSCLLESTTEMYCSLEDAYEFMEFHQQGELQRMGELADRTDEEYSPLEGYFLLNREVPIVTDWLEKVIVGVKPRLRAESNYKIGVLDDLVEAIRIREDSLGNFSDQKYFYHTLTDTEAKKNKIFQILGNLVGALAEEGSVFGESKQARDQNFFTITIPKIKMPFYLIGWGKDEAIPDLVAKGNEETGLTRVTWDIYMQRGGAYISRFDDPDGLIEIVERRLKDVLALSMKKATDFFVQRYIYDQPNLSSEFMVGQAATTISPRDAMVRIKNYLTRLQTAMLNDLDRAPLVESEAHRYLIQNYHPVQLIKVSETIEKITNVLNYFTEIRERAGKAIAIFQRKYPEYEDMDLAGKRNLLFERRWQAWQERGREGKPVGESDRSWLEGTISGLTETQINRLLALEFEHAQSRSLRRVLGDNEDNLYTFSQLVENVYDEFNMWIQRHTFLRVRLEQTVKYEYQYLTRFRDLSPYLQDLLLVSGVNLLSNLSTTFRHNPAETMDNLRMATGAMLQNIRSLDRLFSDSMVPMILEYKFISERNENSDITISLNSLGRYFKDSLGLGLTGLGLLWNYWQHWDRYPFYVLSLDPYKQVLREDAHGTFEQLKSRLCLQSLTFLDLDKFSSHCMGSILRTPYQGDSSSYYLSASYNRLLADYTQAQHTGEEIDQAKAQRRLTCALRDYYRRNLAHYLQVSMR